MPSDIIGSEILDENRQFKFVKGPLFSNIILADEINRTPPKTQSALLEAMQATSNSVLHNPFSILGITRAVLRDEELKRRHDQNEVN